MSYQVSQCKQGAFQLISLRTGFNALVIGSTGGIGSAVSAELKATDGCASVTDVSRSGDLCVNLLDEGSVAALADQLRARELIFDLIFDATGELTVDGHAPEKSLSAIGAQTMTLAFAINATGPALLLKYLTPLLRRDSKSVFATLSARVGSISDNQLGGWYSYRASKSALNQIVKTAAIEIGRTRPQAVCLALHPGTVETALSEPYALGRFTHSPAEAAHRLLDVIDHADAGQSGQFLAYDGSPIPW